MTDIKNAPADRATGFLRRLHPITRIIIAGAVVSFCGDLMQAIGIVSAFAQGSATQSLAPSIATLLASVGYSIGYIGAAASVEYLFRIWREVSLIRKRGETSEPL